MLEMDKEKLKQRRDEYVCGTEDLGWLFQKFADTVCEPASNGVLVACERSRSKIGKLEESIQSAIQAGRGVALALVLY